MPVHLAVPPDTIVVHRVVRDTLWQTTYVLREGKDVGDWLMIVSSVLIGPVVSLAAALLGAREGGKAAQAAAIEAQRVEAEAAARQRREEETRERAERFRRASRRMRYRLERMREFPRGEQIGEYVPSPSLTDLTELRAILDAAIEEIGGLSGGIPYEAELRLRRFLEKIAAVVALGLQAAEQLPSLQAEHGSKGGPAFTAINRLKASVGHVSKALLDGHDEIDREIAELLTMESSISSQ